MTSSRPRALATTPLFVVADVDRAARFYCESMGFQEPAFWGDPPCFCMIHRDQFDLMLGLAESTDQIQPNGRQGIWDLYIRVSDLDAERAALERAGARIVLAPHLTEYGFKELDVVDPDGHRICFGQDMG